MNSDLEKKLSFINHSTGTNLQPDDLLKSLNQNLQQNKPLTSFQFDRLSKSGKIQTDEEGGLLIEPNKSFCIKTFNTENGEKIFINVVSHNAVEKPEETEILQENRPSAGFRIPMSVLPPITYHAKEVSLLIDACVNSFVTKKLNEETFRGEMTDFFIQVLFSYLYQKFKIECSDQFKILVKCKYKGSYLQNHRIRYKKAPKIKVVETASDFQEQETVFQPTNISGDNSGVIRPEFEIILLYEDGIEEIFDGVNWDEDVIGIGFVFKTPLLTTGKYIDIRANDEELEIRNKIYEITLRMPKRVQIDTFKSNFNEEERILKITGNFIKIIEEDEPIDSREIPLTRAKINLESALINDIV